MAHWPISQWGRLRWSLAHKSLSLLVWLCQSLLSPVPNPNQHCDRGQRLQRLLFKQLIQHPMTTPWPRCENKWKCCLGGKTEIRFFSWFTSCAHHAVHMARIAVCIFISAYIFSSSTTGMWGIGEGVFQKESTSTSGVALFKQHVLRLVPH